MLVSTSHPDMQNQIWKAEIQQSKHNKHEAADIHFFDGQLCFYSN